MKIFISLFILLLPIGLLVSILSTLCDLEIILKQIFNVLNINIENITDNTDDKKSNNSN